MVEINGKKYRRFYLEPVLKEEDRKIWRDFTVYVLGLHNGKATYKPLRLNALTEHEIFCGNDLEGHEEALSKDEYEQLQGEIDRITTTFIQAAAAVVSAAKTQLKVLEHLENVESME